MIWAVVLVARNIMEVPTMNSAQKAHDPHIFSPIDAEGAFSRLDESDDGVFYAMDRFVSHLDSAALATVERVVGGKR
jgi:hypothetical protein